MCPQIGLIKQIYNILYGPFVLNTSRLSLLHCYREAFFGPLGISADLDDFLNPFHQ